MKNTFDRRDFLKISTAPAAFWLMNPSSFLAQTAEQKPIFIDPKIESDFYRQPDLPKAAKRLKILVLGGTRFLGTPTVQYAVERGHDVTIFNRGVSNPHLFPKLKRIKADRMSDAKNIYAPLLKENWDAVIDTWQNSPLVVQESAEVLKDNAKQYIYVSSIAVYGRENYVKPEITEDNPLPAFRPMPTDKNEELNYRQKKQLADDAVRKTFPANSTVVRCHVIAGYYLEPHSEAQIYWIARFKRGGDVLCPGDGVDQMQMLDVKDAARWLVKSAEENLTGIYNLGRRYTWTKHVAACRALTSAPTKIHWISFADLQSQKIKHDSDLPLYIPRHLGPGFFNICDDKASSKGMIYRPLTETLTDIYAGFQKHYPKDFVFGKPLSNAGISWQQEQEVLRNLKKI